MAVKLRAEGAAPRGRSFRVYAPLALLIGCWEPYSDGERPPPGLDLTIGGSSSGEGSTGVWTSSEGSRPDSEGETSGWTGSGGLGELDSGTDEGDDGDSGDGGEGPITAPSNGCGGFVENLDSKASWIFVTKAVFQGDLVPPVAWKVASGGWAEAGRTRGDRVCQCAASRANLRGEFVAWLSVQNVSMKNSLKEDGALDEPRHFVRRDGSCVAESWAVLLSEGHHSSISVTELGDAVDGAGRTWTGTDDGGGGASPWCGGWGAKGGLFGGVIGRAHAVKSGWSRSWVLVLLWLVSESDPCSRENHLYCLQVGDDAPGDVEQYCQVEKE